MLVGIPFYPFLTYADKKWKKVENWVPNNFPGATKIDAYSTRLGVESERNTGKLMETVFIGKDAYYRFPFVEGSGPHCLDTCSDTVKGEHSA